MDKPEYAVEELLKDHQIFHSNLQMDCFITGMSGGTDYGMYKQALRELDKRYRGLRHLYIERERLRMEMPRKVTVGLQFKFQRRRALKAVEAGYALEDVDRTIADTEREFARFLQQARVLKQRVGDLTPERRAVLDEEFWVDRLKRTAAIEYMTLGRPNANTVECINALPVKVRERLVAELQPGQAGNLVRWYRGLPPPNIPALPSDEGEDAKLLPRRDVEGLIGERFDGSVPVRRRRIAPAPEPDEMSG